MSGEEVYWVDYDPRFRGLVTNSDYSIDVTNPMFVKTKNMAKLVDSVTKKRKKE